MYDELEALKAIGERLRSANIPFMLTGSFAMAYYARPRMTRDLDLVVAISASDVDALVASLASDFYVDAENLRVAIATERLSNVLHHRTSVKVDLIVRKSTEYRRRVQRIYGGTTEIMKDLIARKLLS
jgi:alkylation response protein AidB-like acyl-CoA dehydrogenase